MTGHLPAVASSFVGRARELAELSQLLPESRLITLTGAGGSGKTRLAVELASDVADERWAGCWFIDLSPISDMALVAPTIGRVLNLVGEAESEPIEALARGIGERPVALLLDNLEQLPGIGALIGQLLTSCPRLHLLCTSRVSLHVRGEREYPVEPLPIPSTADQESVGRLHEYASVALFEDRASAIDPRFALSDQNAWAVAEICRRLDGLPLAIELAAARIRLFEAPALLARLEQRLPLLTGGAADAPTRQRTLRDTIAWSVDLLEPGERDTFVELSVFVGGFTGSAAAAVAWPLGRAPDSDPSGPAMDPGRLATLEGLVDRNLLRVAAGEDGQPRFDMLETVREFAWDQLDGQRRGELRDRHLRWVVAFAEAAQERARGEHQRDVIRQLLAEKANVRAALEHASEEQNEDALVRVFAALPRRFWSAGDGLREGRAWFDTVHPFTHHAPPSVQIRALRNGSWIAEALGSTDRTALFEEILQVAEKADDDIGRFESSIGLTYVALEGGRIDVALQRVEMAETAAARTGRAGDLAETLTARARVERLQGQTDDAMAHLGVAAALGRSTNDQWATAWALDSLGDIYLAGGDSGLARATFEASLEQAEAAGDAELIAWAGVGLSRSLTRLGRLAEARATLLERAASTRELRHPFDELITLDAGNEWLAAAGLVGDAVECSAAAAQFRKGRNYWDPLDDEQRSRAVQRMRAELGAVRFNAAWERGAGRDLDQAIAVMIEAVERADALSVAGREPELRRFELTEREREILPLVAAGMSDGEIADALVISKKTVSVHVANVKGKLGARNRVEIATIAARLGVLSGTDP